MSSLRYQFKIPDPARPIGGERPPWGPFCELVEFHPERLTADRIVGRAVDEICTCAGTYGMGGPGFLGLRLGDKWLIIAIWGAASWAQFDGRIVQDVFWDTNEWPRPWITEAGDELSGELVDRPITSFEVARRSLVIGIAGRTLSIQESPFGRPIHEGNKQPRSFEESDDLTRAVFLSPTTELWV
jgi:hypothetical protein